MNQKIKIWLWILAWILLTLIVTYFIWKNEENKKLEMLWISKEQAQEIKNELKSYEDKNKSDSLNDDEINFFESKWLKKDPNWLYYTYDKYQLDSKKIFFKKENWEWKWSILLWNWDNLDDYKYDNTSSIYNWYVIKQDKTKEVFEKLSGKQINNSISQNTEEVKKEIDVINVVKNENTSNNTRNNDKYIYSLFENSDWTYTFLWYWASVNQKEEIKKLAISKWIDWDKVKIVRADSDELIYRKNLELSSKNPTKMKEFLSLLKEWGDQVDRDDYFKTIYKYNVSKENLEKYSEQISEIKEFWNIELIEK